LPQGDEQLALAAEVVIQAAHAGPGPLDHIGDARTGEALLGEHFAGGVEERTLRFRGTRPLPRAGSLVAWLPGCRFHRSLPIRAAQARGGFVVSELNSKSLYGCGFYRTGRFRVVASDNAYRHVMSASRAST